MSVKERAVIYVDSGCASMSSLNSMTSSSSSSTTNPLNPCDHSKAKGKNYVIKIQIGEEGIFNRPVRIDVAGAHQHHRQRHHLPPDDGDSLSIIGSSSSGQSSPRSDMTPPPPPRPNKGSSLCRFGSETSESDTESDISAEYPHILQQIGFISRKNLSGHSNIPNSAAQFARRDLLGNESDSDGKNFYFKNGEEGQGGCLIGENFQFQSSLKDHLNSSLIKVFSESQFGKSKSPPPSYPPPSRPSDQSRVSPDPPQLTPSIDKRRFKVKSSPYTTIPESVVQYGPIHPPSKIIIDQDSFHLQEFNHGKMEGGVSNEAVTNFAGYKDLFSRALHQGPSEIMSDKGTIRGVKNRVRDGIATFLQSTDSKNYNEKEQGRVVVYVTSMGVVRDTYQRCQKVKQILRNLLVKFDERDCYMNQGVQIEIRERFSLTIDKKKEAQDEQNGLGGGSSSTIQKFQSRAPVVKQTNLFHLVTLPQVFIEGQHLGGLETIEKLNETGELRKMLKPYMNVSVLNTCENCGGFRMTPCPVCNGSKKSVHRNHFTEEFVALKCMHCDPVGLVKCPVCNP